MNKYILLLGITGVALGSYCAYADNSATMTVTATIEHDVSLSIIRDLNLGTITLDPTARSCNFSSVSYNIDGTVENICDIIEVTDVTPGIFTANIANPSACDGSSYECGGLKVPADTVSMFGGGSESHYCTRFVIAHDSSNKFKVMPRNCALTPNTTPGIYEYPITIEYTAS